MEIQLPSLALLLFSLLLLIKLIFKRGKSAANLPPGPRKLPIIGNLHNLVGAVPHRALQKLASKYGDVMHLQIGELSSVVISSPEAARQVMKTHDINFASRPPVLVAEIISYGCTSITFGPYGDYWRQLRKICTTELLSVKRVQSFRPIREQVYRDVSQWIASREGTVVNLTEKMLSSTYAVVATIALGRKHNEDETLMTTLKEVIHLASGFTIADLYPSNKLLQLTLRKKLEKLHRRADKILEEIIRDHRVDNEKQSRSVDDETEKEKVEDLVDVLLKFQDDSYDIPLTTENIKSVILDVLGAGSETSTTSMDWTMVEMLKNPHVLKKAQEEVRRVFDPKGYVDESGIQELEYLKLVIKESLRLHTAAPLLLPRKASEKCVINGYDIPAETKIIVNAWATSRDPKYWEEPEEFRPERFIDSSLDYKGNNFEYIPFGAGRRICPGISFGIASVSLPLATFLYHFDWKLPNGMKPEEMDMGEGYGLTARRAKDLCVIPVINRPLPVK